MPLYNEPSLTAFELLAELRRRAQPAPVVNTHDDSNCNTKAPKATQTDTAKPAQARTATGYGINGGAYGGECTPVGSGVYAAPKASPISSVYQTVKFKSPELQRELQSINVGEAIRLTAGRVVYRAAPDLYLDLYQSFFNVHRSLVFLPSSAKGEVLPRGTEITITL